MIVFAPVQFATSPKSNHVIWLVKDLGSRSGVKPGFSTFGVEVASTTSAPIPVVAAVSARKAVFLSISFPLRGSFFPVFAIAFVPSAGAVFSAGFAVVASVVAGVSTTGFSTFATSLFLSFALTVVTSDW